MYIRKWFFNGLIAFISMMILPAPTGLNETGWSVAAIVALMAIWWATEAIPVPVTAASLALFY